MAALNGNFQDPFANDNDIDVDVNDPHPDIFELFIYYRDLYFGEGRLDGVSVEWSSKRMTSCGGTCQRMPGGAIIKLSQPLLILRPSRDLKMVLLHEMIHAYCMVNQIQDPDPSGHGAPFQKFMNGINSSTVSDIFRPSSGYNITVYHTMFNEVEYYRQHHWKCERCGVEVKRATNRRPQEADCWLNIKPGGGQECRDTRCKWHMHLRHCGGEYIKIKEPEGYAQNNNKKRKKKDGQACGGTGGGGGGTGGIGIGSAFPGQRAITGWLKPPSSTNGNGNATLPALNAVLQQGNHEKLQPPVSAQERRALYEAAALRRSGQQATNASNPTLYPQKHQIELINLVEEDVPSLSSAAPPSHPLPTPQPSSPVATAANPIICPICGAQFPANENAALNTHLDDCLALSSCS